ncbi:hypothetical protein AcW1_004418 [Taiwanofungus camphoratus]|nr:hypothetical protein AcW1_004418 [Antrodia cinnamomea]
MPPSAALPAPAALEPTLLLYVQYTTNTFTHHCHLGHSSTASVEHTANAQVCSAAARVLIPIAGKRAGDCTPLSLHIPGFDTLVFRSPQVRAVFQYKSTSPQLPLPLYQTCGLAPACLCN